MGSPARCSQALLMVVFSAIITGFPLSPLASSEYEEMGPLDVVVFQTSMPSLGDLAACNPLSVDVARVPTGAGYEKPPARLLIAAPSSQGGEYPVFLFKHGTNLANCQYSQLLEHIASYGYVVVAPQTAFELSLDCSNDVDNTAAVVDWMPGNLAELLASEAGAGVAADLGRVFLAGHSRGAKVALALALGLTGQPARSSFSGLVALDPVDGMEILGNITVVLQPPIVTRSACELGYPALIQGTGLGASGLMPCAPAGYSHQAFFACASAPIAYHLVAAQYGHMEFLNDGFSFTKLMCVSGSQDRALLRKFTAGLVLAFLDSALTGSTSPMADALATWDSASIILDEPQCSSKQTTIPCPGVPSTSTLSTMCSAASE